MKPPTNLLHSLRALPGPVWVLCLGTFLNRFGTFVIPFLTLYLTGRGFSVGQAGIAIGVYGIGNVLATIVGGFMADHFGRRKTIAVAMFGGAAVMLALSQAERFPVILGLAFLSGLVGELYRPASSALLGDLVPEENRVTAYSTYRMAINAGFAFGPAAAGFLASRGYLWLFVGDAFTSVLFGVVALVALPEGTHGHSEVVVWRESVGVLAADRRLRVVLIGAFGTAALFCQMTSTFSLAVKHLGFSAAQYGLLLSLNGALVALLELPLTVVTRRFRPLPVIALGYAVVGLGFLGLAPAHALGSLALCIGVFTLGEMIAMPVAGAYVSSLSPANLRGRYMGAYGLTWTIAQIFIPGLSMGWFQVLGPWFWVAGGLVGLVSAASVLLGRSEGRGPLSGDADA